MKLGVGMKGAALGLALSIGSVLPAAAQDTSAFATAAWGGSVGISRNSLVPVQDPV